MENNSLSHWGIKGMRWGVRRYQNKDGSLTALGRKRQLNEDNERDSIEERKTRLLKSTDANELYKNRDLLTTAELNERLNRLDAERRLSQVAASTKKSGMERVDSILKTARKVDEVYKFVNESTVGKLVKNKLFGKVEKNLSPDLKKLWENRDKVTDKTLTDALKRVNTEKAIKKIIDENDAAAKAEAQKQVDAYNAKQRDKQTIKDSYYHKKGKDVVDSVLDNNTKVSDVPNETLLLGQTYIAGLLPEKVS